MKSEKGADGLKPDCVCLHLRMSARAISQFYDDVMRPSGIRNTQFSMLGAIHKLGPVTFQRLSEFLVLDQTTLPRNLRLLEKDGYIKIEEGKDRRERLASLTPKGRSVLEAALPLWRKAQAQIRSRFDPQRLEHLHAELLEMRRAVAK
ncbi:MAG TPA: MarR family winged helix-turn-helix transcriptional regulator [Elusimicrobiota bacterium]|nr:MarR family winged helix-turn-helix transcriptional regulator [Elusimicrobiota bacterium]